MSSQDLRTSYPLHPSTDWRCNGSGWEHKCKDSIPQAGHFPGVKLPNGNWECTCCREVLQMCCIGRKIPLNWKSDLVGCHIEDINRIRLSLRQLFSSLLHQKTMVALEAMRVLVKGYCKELKHPIIKSIEIAFDSERYDQLVADLLNEKGDRVWPQLALEDIRVILE